MLRPFLRASDSDENLFRPTPIGWNFTQSVGVTVFASSTIQQNLQSRQEAMKMRLKSIATLIAVIGFTGALFVSGCHHRSATSEAELGSTLSNVAPSDVKADGKSN